MSGRAARPAARRLQRPARQLLLLLPADDVHRAEHRADAAALRVFTALSVDPSRLMRSSRHVDQADGARAPDDRAVRGQPDARRASSPTACRRTATTSAWPTSSRSSPTSTTRSSTRRTSTRSRSSTSRPTSASSRRTRSPWRARSSTSGFPRDILTVCLGKSTYARCGIIVNVTPFEPEWEGHVTIEISNTTPLPAKIYANEGIAQVLFFQSDEPCEVSYRDKKGKYQAQRGVTLPKI